MTLADQVLNPSRFYIDRVMSTATFGAAFANRLQRQRIMNSQEAMAEYAKILAKKHWSSPRAASLHPPKAISGSLTVSKHCQSPDTTSPGTSKTFKLLPGEYSISSHKSRYFNSLIIDSTGGPVRINLFTTTDTNAQLAAVLNVLDGDQKIVLCDLDSSSRSASYDYKVFQGPVTGSVRRFQVSSE